MSKFDERFFTDSLRQIQGWRVKGMIDWQRNDGCWIWRGHINKRGYGRAMFEGRAQLVHRILFERYVQAVPEDLQLDHLCRVRNCCNPEHLEIVTAKENWDRSEGGSAKAVQKLNSNKTHCPRNHPYDEANTGVRRDGRRYCRGCWRDRRREWARRNPDKVKAANAKRHT